MNNFLIKLKEKIFPISKFKLIIYIFIIIFVIYSYYINSQIDYKGFLFMMMFFPSIIFGIILLILMFIRHYIATILFVIISVYFIYIVSRTCGSFDYFSNKIKDPCYKQDNAAYIGKGPWEYNLGDRKCVGERYMGGDTIIYKTEN